MFDADGSADPDEITRFVDALTSGADFAKGSRFAVGGGSADITRIRGLGNKFLNFVANRSFGQNYTDLCYGYNAFWADILPVLDLPSTDVPLGSSTEMTWGDGFEIETVINCRVAAAGLVIIEIPSIEKLRIFGASNLNAVSDGIRVIRSIRMEWTRARDISRQAGVPGEHISVSETPAMVGAGLVDDSMDLVSVAEETA
jgi:hypothetical protein